jgi:hypothetical protein
MPASDGDRLLSGNTFFHHHSDSCPFDFAQDKPHRNYNFSLDTGELPEVRNSLFVLYYEEAL